MKDSWPSVVRDLARDAGIMIFALIFWAVIRYDPESRRLLKSALFPLDPGGWMYKPKEKSAGGVYSARETQA